MSAALAVLDKLLNRAEITLCTRRIEQTLVDELRLPDVYAAGSVREETLIADAYSSPRYTKFDSEEERLFYECVLEPVLGTNASRWCIPQVELGSLCKDVNAPIGRVDFLVYVPGFIPFVVEIDGKQHDDQSEHDDRRDDALTESGYETLRIPAHEIRSESQRWIEDITQRLDAAHGISEAALAPTVKEKAANLAKVSHQFQVALLEAACRGSIDLSNPGEWNIGVELNCPLLADGAVVADILRAALDDFVDLARHTCQLYQAPWTDGQPQLALDAPSADVQVVYGESRDPRAYHIQNISVPFSIAHESVILASIPQVDAKEETLTFFLREIFRKETFLEGQLDGIRRAMSGLDALILLPTGAGKSLIFQFASLLLPGVSVVVAPIIALIEDQLSNLRENGIDRCVGISSRIRSVEEREQIQSMFGQGHYLICYVAPERFQIAEFRNALRSLTIHTPINLVAIDEAHCVSEWGHDFRPAYLNIARTAREYCRSEGRVPAVLGLTGTASRSVLKDVQRELEITEYEAIITPASFDREELSFHVITSRSDEKLSVLEGLIGRHLPGQFGVSAASFFQPRGAQTACGIVFCPHVNGDFGVIHVADAMRNSLSLSAEPYASTMPGRGRGRNVDRWTRQIRQTASQFRRNRVPLLVATKAFGMGIDKPNIRYTIHYCIPPSIESFYQEAGRAGRDRSKSICTVMVSVDDQQRARRLLDPNTAIEQVAEIVNDVPWDEADDITRVLWFHANAFRGVTVELEHLRAVYEVLSASPDSRAHTISLGDTLERNEAEKALHRLVVIGVVEDYTVNYSAREFTAYVTRASNVEIGEAYVRYVAGYNVGRSEVEGAKVSKVVEMDLAPFTLSVAELLVRFIYEVIENGRRRALSEMLAAVASDHSDAGVRSRILQYLEQTPFSGVLEEMVERADGGVGMVEAVFSDVLTPNDAAELRGESARFLESYPDLPGALFLRSLSEAYSRDADIDTVRENFLAGMTSASKNYSVPQKMVVTTLIWMIERIHRVNADQTEHLTYETMRRYPDTSTARTLVGQLPRPLASIPAWALLADLASKARSLTVRQER